MKLFFRFWRFLRIIKIFGKDLYNYLPPSVQLAIDIKNYKVTQSIVNKHIERVGKENNYSLRSFSDLEINRYKSSDTLFILGSGGSVNYYSEENWEELKRGDSFAMGYWMMNEMSPTFYSLEIFKRTQLMDGTVNNLIHNLNVAKRKLKNTRILIKTNRMIDDLIEYGKFDDNLRENLYVNMVIYINSLNYEWYKRKLFNLKNKGYFNLRSSFTNPIQTRASVFFAVNFGVIAGYRKIVLCGVDLNNTKYYFHNKEDYYKKRGYIIPETKKGKVHSNIDCGKGELTLDIALRAYKEIVIDPKGIEIYTALKSSALYPMLDSYFE